MRLTRFYMYKQITKCFKTPISGKILGISGIEDIKFIIDQKNSEITLVDYPQVDMQRLPFNDETFDYVISDQVIEHLENPFKAINESNRVLKRGGIAIHTTCFLNYYHPAPNDFWRFSPECLKFICKEFSQIIQCEGFGNKFAAMLCLISDRLRAMEIPDNYLSIRHLLATYNDIKYPITTWIIAQK